MPVRTDGSRNLSMQQSQIYIGFGAAMAAMNLSAFPTLIFFMVTLRCFVRGVA